MRGFVANTDFDWFTFLSARQPLEEVNFWQPSGGDSFRALEPGEPFFFRLKKPHYAIAGFGLFARHEVVTAKLAWEAFGERNGAADFGAMCARIEKYRRDQPAPRWTGEIRPTADGSKPANGRDPRLVRFYPATSSFCNA